MCGAKMMEVTLKELRVICDEAEGHFKRNPRVKKYVFNLQDGGNEYGRIAIKKNKLIK